MEKEAYILKQLGRSVAVIIADNPTQLLKKTTQAIEVEIDEDGFELILGRIGDFGENTEVVIDLKGGGFNDEFTLMKTIFY